MRFTGRSGGAQGSKTSPGYADHVSPLDHTSSPHKADSFFGARIKLGRKTTVSKSATGKGGLEKSQQDHQQKSWGTGLRAGEASLDTREALLEDMPERKGKLNVWPNVERENRSATDVRNLHGYYPTSRPGIPPRRTSSNAVANHYDPTKHPYYVSQQTSDSAVRDMGLHKVLPMTIHETASDPTLARRPLKSALKKHSSPEANEARPDTLLRLDERSSERKPRRLDLSQFLPRQPSRRLLSPTAPARSPSALADPADFSPRETVHVQLARPTAHAPYAAHKTAKPRSVDSNSTARAKVFEADIFDRAKTHVRRPPKGIQNWFDGFDISSEEDSEPEKPPDAPSADAHELPAHDLPSTFSPWHIKPVTEQPRLDRKASRDPVEDNLLAIAHAKERMQERMRGVGGPQRKGSVDSGTLASVVSSSAEGPPDRRRGGGSRLALSELASQSVLSLSDSSGDERARARRGYEESADDASLVAVASSAPPEPAPAPRKGSRKHSAPGGQMVARQSTSTVRTAQTSGSIPIRLTNSIPLPTSSFLPETPQAVVDTAQADATAQTLRRLLGQSTPRSS
ncbi:hypothetical protein LTR53_016216, partial [Teratosphaeriaceae sp. CCFEE 6253]